MNPINHFGLNPCNLCPRECGKNRTKNETGFCGLDSKIKVARVALHFWEESCISGARGSGTVFFSGCNLKCVYCQNEKISRGKVGKELSTDELAEAFLYLQGKGAHNINLVTPTHYSTEIIKALDIAKRKGLNLPIVYNTSGYEKPEIIKALKDYVDIYLTDFKYYDENLAEHLSKAKDYTYFAKLSLAQMVANVGEPLFDEQGHMQKGVIVRHLLLPGHKKNSKAVIDYLANEYRGKVILSFMNQYTPCNSELKKEEYSDINRKVTRREYDMLCDYIISCGFEDAYIQEGETATESFIPDFFDEDIWK